MRYYSSVLATLAYDTFDTCSIHSTTYSSNHLLIYRGILKPSQVVVQLLKFRFRNAGEPLASHHTLCHTHKTSNHIELKTPPNKYSTMYTQKNSGISAPTCSSSSFPSQTPTQPIRTHHHQPNPNHLTHTPQTHKTADRPPARLNPQRGAAAGASRVGEGMQGQRRRARRKARGEGEKAERRGEGASADGGAVPSPPYATPWPGSYQVRM